MGTRQEDNWDPERRTDPEWVSRKAPCCGCHPDVHDYVVGCMLCSCPAGGGSDGRIFEEEFSTLVAGSTVLLVEKVMGVLGIGWCSDGGRRYVTAGQYRRMESQIRMQVSLRARIVGGAGTAGGSADKSTTLAKSRRPPACPRSP